MTFPLADALCWLLASRCQILDVLELAQRGRDDPAVAEALPGLVSFFTDLCHVQAARAAGEVGRICAELVFGYRRHPAWDEAGCGACYQADELEALESVIPGISVTALAYSDVIERDGTHAAEGRPVRSHRRPRAVHAHAHQDGRLPDRRRAWPRTGRPRRSPR